MSETHAPPSNPFQVHLTFFSTTPTALAATNARPHITLLSGLRRSLAIGLNFPAAVLVTISLRLLYGSPWNLFLRPVDVRAVKTRRTMLEDVHVRFFADVVTQGSLLRDIRASGKGVADTLHVLGLWRVAADANNGILKLSDTEACRKGELLWQVEERRKLRDGMHGEVLPFLRGGPIS